ncbi:Unknown protein, partial [Striga hermonthica]
KEQRAERKSMANKEMKDKINNLDVQFRGMSEAIDTLGEGLDNTKTTVQDLMETVNRRFDEMARTVLARLPPPLQHDRTRHHDRERVEGEEHRREEYECEEQFDQQSQASNYRERRAHNKSRITLSTFTGSDPDAWLNRATQYFELNETDDPNRVSYAAYYLDGEANVWWQWLIRIYRKRQQIITWDVFEKEFLTRFSTSDYHNNNETLIRIRQTGSMREYIREFEWLACRVCDWHEDALVGAFVGGLNFDLAAEVRLERPDTMHDAMEVAPRREDHLVATRRGRADARFADTRRTGLSQATTGTRTAINARPAGAVVRRLSPEEVKRRREKGLCFTCEEMFTPGHQYKQAFITEVANFDDEETEVEEELEPADNLEAFDEEPETSMHAMAGIRGSRPMRLLAWVKDRRIIVLIDNSSSHNFINADLSQKLKLPTPKIEPFEVRVANGERLQCTESFQKVPIKFNRITVMADLYALPLVGPDIVLGVQWLERLGKVTTDYRMEIMEFNSGGRQVTLSSGNEKGTKEVGLKSIERV